MAQTLEQLGQQEQALSSIRGIVRTMKTLAAVNAAPYEQAAEAIEAYRHTIKLGFAAFAYRTSVRGLLSATPLPQRRVLVAFGSDHGFCGNYNEVLAELVSRHAASENAGNRHVLCVGAKLQRALEEHGVSTAQRLMPPASVDSIGRLAGEIVTHIEQISRGQSLATLAVSLAYTRRAEYGSREATVSALLPLSPELLQAPQRWPSRSLPDYSMEPAILLSALLRNHIFASVFRASAEAMVTENAARLALMQQAEQTVDERLEEVQRQISSVRQDEITNEMMDIIIGHVDEA